LCRLAACGDWYGGRWPSAAAKRRGRTPRLRALAFDNLAAAAAASAAGETTPAPKPTRRCGNREISEIANGAHGDACFQKSGGVRFIGGAPGTGCTNADDVGGDTPAGAT